LKLFELCEGFSLINSNIRTSTEEIDMEYRLNTEMARIFSSNELVIEAKNLKNPVNSAIIGTFHSKLILRQSNAGVVIATHSFTKDSIQKSFEIFLRNKVMILLFDDRDINQIIEGKKDLLYLIYEERESIRNRKRVRT